MDFVALNRIGTHKKNLGDDSSLALQIHNRILALRNIGQMMIPTFNKKADVTCPNSLLQ